MWPFWKWSWAWYIAEIGWQGDIEIFCGLRFSCYGPVLEVVLEVVNVERMTAHKNEYKQISRGDDTLVFNSLGRSFLANTPCNLLQTCTWTNSSIILYNFRDSTSSLSWNSFYQVLRLIHFSKLPQPPARPPSVMSKENTIVNIHRLITPPSPSIHFKPHAQCSFGFCIFRFWLPSFHFVIGSSDCFALLLHCVQCLNRTIQQRESTQILTSFSRS